MAVLSGTIDIYIYTYIYMYNCIYLFQNLHLGKGASAERAPPATASCSAQPGDALWLENRHVKSLWKKCELIFEGAKFPKSCPHLLQIESGQQGSKRHPKNDRS